MAFRIFKNSGNGSGANGEVYLVIAPIVANGITGKRLTNRCIVKHVIVKSTVDAPGFKLGTVAAGDDIVYHTDLPAGVPQIISPFAITNAVADLYVSGYAGGVISIIIIYQKINI